jgi:type I restriction enzyme S subunit
MLRAQREIDLIREYRTRLISDVVTGKVDVRHLAAAPGSEDLEESAEAIEPLEEVAGEPDEETFAGKVDL